MPKKSRNSIATVACDDWETRNDLDTLIQAERIEKDPKRMAKVQALAKQRMLDMAGIAAEGKDES
jgi:hypothetical protein